MIGVAHALFLGQDVVKGFCVGNGWRPLAPHWPLSEVETMVHSSGRMFDVWDVKCYLLSVFVSFLLVSTTCLLVCLTVCEMTHNVLSQTTSLYSLTGCVWSVASNE